MGRRRGSTAGMIVLLLPLLFVVACQRQDSRLAALERAESASPNPAGIEELESVIEEYASIVNDKVEAGIRQAQYLKYLGQEYMRNEMYGLALAALEEAIDLEPQNQVLQQLAGICSAYMAKAQGRAEAKNDYYEMAEQYYQRAIELDPDYLEANYGLAVLYVFELDRSLEALPYIEHSLEISPNHVPALFLLANANVAIGDFDAAIDAYDRIIRTADDREAREEAARNRQLLVGGES